MTLLTVEYSRNEWVVRDGFDRKHSGSVAESDLKTFKKWIETYQDLKKNDQDQKELLALGREIFAWLNGGEMKSGWLNQVLENVESPLFVEFQISKKARDPLHAFIEVPWELLADEQGHLAKDPDVKFCPLRRTGSTRLSVRPPSPYCLNTVFMAASPRNVEPVLAYEEEESVILNLREKSGVNMDLTVEGSGNLDQLVRLVSQVKEVDVVHISCHGNIEEGARKHPYLCLEDPTGNVKKINVEQFCQTFSVNKPKLLFLSACKTSEPSEGKNRQEQIVYQSLVQSLCRAGGISAILGWSGSVSDDEATRFAGEFYRNLSLGEKVGDALVNARNILFDPPKDHDELKEYTSKAWHLARLYLGPNGGGVLATGELKRTVRGYDAGVKKFLDKKGERGPVVSRSEFVGRRREIQNILKDYHHQGHAGVLVLGNQGKSSLAARVANRLHDHQTVVIFGDKDNKKMYSEDHLLNELKTVADPETEARICGLQKQIEAYPSTFTAALKGLLEGPFATKSGSKKPILLVMDDLEKLLEAPGDKSGVYTVEADFQNVLVSVVKAFKEARTDSRLLMTCRYDFDLIDHDEIDVGMFLLKVPLPSMNDTEAKK